MMTKKGHRDALMHLARQMREMEFANPSHDEAGEDPAEEAMESKEEEAMEDDPMKKLAKDAEGDDGEMEKRRDFMMGKRPIKKAVSVTIVAPMHKGKMKRG